MKSIQTTAKTRAGEFEVNVEIETSAMGATMKPYITINGKSLRAIAGRKENEKNLIFVTPEICKELGIKYSRNLAMRCDLTAARVELEYAVHEMKRKQNEKYDGKIIDSGFGFAMKNTKRNWGLVSRMGYDAIDHVS